MEKSLINEINRMRSLMDVEDKTIDIPNDPNTMNFFHGGDLDQLKDTQIYKSARQQFGTGLYLTTSYDVVKKYAKGGRKLYLVTVENGVDIDSVKFDINELMGFLNQNFSRDVVKKITEYMGDRIVDGQVPGYLINNILINHKLLKPRNSASWQNFLIQNGVDYELVDNAFGYHDTMMVLYNTNKIKDIRRIMPNDRLPYYNLKTRD